MHTHTHTHTHAHTNILRRPTAGGCILVLSRIPLPEVREREGWGLAAASTVSLASVSESCWSLYRRAPERAHLHSFILGLLPRILQLPPQADLVFHGHTEIADIPHCCDLCWLNANRMHRCVGFVQACPTARSGGAWSRMARPTRGHQTWLSLHLVY